MAESQLIDYPTGESGRSRGRGVIKASSNASGSREESEPDRISSRSRSKTLSEVGEVEKSALQETAASPILRREFWPAVGYEMVDTSSSLVLALLESGHRRLSRLDVCSLLLPDFRNLLKAYTLRLQEVLPQVSSQPENNSAALLQGLINEVTALDSCIAAWHPKLYMLEKDGASRGDWQAVLKALDLRPWQIQDLLARRSTYLLTHSNFADIVNTTGAAEYMEPTSQFGDVPSLGRTCSIYHQNRRQCSFTNRVLRQVLTPLQAGRAIVVAAPHYPDMLSIIDLLAEGSSGGSITSASSNASDTHSQTGRAHRSPFSTHSPQARESRADFRETCMPVRTRSRSLPSTTTGGQVADTDISDFSCRTRALLTKLGIPCKSSDEYQEGDPDWEPHTPSGDEDSPHSIPEKRQRTHVAPTISHAGAGNWTLVGEAEVDKHCPRTPVSHAARSSRDMPPVTPHHRSLSGMPPAKAQTPRSSRMQSSPRGGSKDSPRYPGWDRGAGAALQAQSHQDFRFYRDDPMAVGWKPDRPHSFDNVARRRAMERRIDAAVLTEDAVAERRRAVSCDVVVPGHPGSVTAKAAALPQGNRQTLAVLPTVSAGQTLAVLPKVSAGQPTASGSAGDWAFTYSLPVSFADWETHSQSSGSGSRRSQHDDREAGTRQQGFDPILDANATESRQGGPAPASDFPRAVTYPVLDGREASSWQASMSYPGTAHQTSTSPVPGASRGADGGPASPFTFQPWLLHSDGASTPQTPSVNGYPRTPIPSAVSLPPPQQYPCGEAPVRNSRSSCDIAQQAVPAWVDFKEFLDTAPMGDLADFPDRCTSFPLSMNDKEVLRLILKSGAADAHSQ